MLVLLTGLSRTGTTTTNKFWPVVGRVIPPWVLLEDAHVLDEVQDCDLPFPLSPFPQIFLCNYASIVDNTI